MKPNLVTAIIILIIIIFSVWTITKNNELIDEDLAKCIGENSVLYVKKGCFACEAQRDLFGDSIKHLEIVDCLTQPEECAANLITSVPTWIINENHYVGVQSIETLKQLTNC